MSIRENAILRWNESYLPEKFVSDLLRTKKWKITNSQSNAVPRATEK
jgi:hypothetical protein